MIALLSDVVLKNLWIPVWSRYRSIDVLLHLAPPVCYSEMRMPQVSFIFDVPQEWENSKPLDRLFNLMFVRYSSRTADSVVTISEYSRAALQREYRVPASRLSVVYPPIDLTLFNPETRPDESMQSLLTRERIESGFVLAVVSRMIKRKNPNAYFEVFARLPERLRRERKLVIVGACSGVNDLRTWVSPETLARCLPYTVFVGRIPTPNLAVLYARAGVLLFLSRFEGFGLPVVEAMACGAPVVATSIPPIAEAVGPGVPLFDADDCDGMAARCCELLSDREKAAEARALGLVRSREFGYEEFALRMSPIVQRAQS
jgi:glycosyltransferase involved in cell wall biosynthesis